MSLARRIAVAALSVLAVNQAVPIAGAHFFVVEADRVGHAPTEAGNGWFAEVFLNLSDSEAEFLLSAEAAIADREPDFTFFSTHIDFPAGPVDSVLDTDLLTIGEFLDDYVVAVSDPAMLDAPMGSFLIRFSGLLNARLTDSTFSEFGLPTLIDFATRAHGGFRTRVGVTTIYRVQDTQFLPEPIFTENALMLQTGLFPVEVVYLNRFDPLNQFAQERVGVELYGYFPNGLPSPGGAVLTDPVFGPMTIVPPDMIYQPDELPELVRGDADGDRSVSLSDFAEVQACFSLTQSRAARSGADATSFEQTCGFADLDRDLDVDLLDAQLALKMLSGLDFFAAIPADYDNNQQVDLSDMQWLQFCGDRTLGMIDEEDERPLIASNLEIGCEVFDFDLNGRIDLVDFDLALVLLNAD